MGFVQSLCVLQSIVWKEGHFPGQSFLTTLFGAANIRGTHSILVTLGGKSILNSRFHKENKASYFKFTGYTGDIKFINNHIDNMPMYA